MPVKRRLEKSLPYLMGAVFLAVVVLTGLNLTVLKGDVSTNRATIEQLCQAVAPTRAIYRLALDGPETPQSRAYPEQTARFRVELRNGVAAIDALRCPMP